LGPLIISDEIKAVGLVATWNLKLLSLVMCS